MKIEKMNKDNFETALNRALLSGGLMCFVPIYFFLDWIGVSNLRWVNIWMGIFFFMICLLVVNHARSSFQEKNSKSINGRLVSGVRFLSLIASFLIGMVLSSGVIISWLLFLKKA
jgi:predicted permease